MKKTAGLVLAFLLLVAFGSAASADNTLKYEKVGLTLHGVEALDDCRGVVSLEPYGPIAYGPDADDLSVPVDRDKDLVGTAVRFNTVDLDGNTLTSNELFSENKVTMINYWGTWCHYCVEEMEELAAMHTRLQEKGCGIIGIVQDGYDEERIQRAKEIMVENGTNYPNVLFSDDMVFLADVKSFPTSCFVDANGIILCPPISGVGLERYESSIDRLLEGEAVNTDAPSKATENGENVYRVIVKDSHGEPIPGVYLKACDELTCSIAETNADGIAVFDLPEGTVYTVSALRVPEGYEMNDSSYDTLDVYSDVTIVIRSAV